VLRVGEKAIRPWRIIKSEVAHQCVVRVSRLDHLTCENASKQ